MTSPTVIRHFGLNKVSGDVGLEIEVEFPKTVASYKGEFWDTKTDGSLRFCGYEYVTKSAISIGSVGKELKDIVEFIKKNNCVPDSPRTSFHVHCNVQSHTLMQVMNAAVFWWLIENAMVKHCGEEYREGNNFCLRVKDAEYMLVTLKNVIKNKFNIGRENIRYSAQNLMSLSRFGTIEYRCHGGVYDADEMNNWVGALHNIVNNTKMFSSPEDVLDSYFAAEDKEQFFRNVLGVHSNILFNVPGWRSLVEENEGLLFNFVYNTEWNLLTKDKLKNVVAPKGVQPMANQADLLRVMRIDDIED